MKKMTTVRCTTSGSDFPACFEQFYDYRDVKNCNSCSCKQECFTKSQDRIREIEESKKVRDMGVWQFRTLIAFSLLLFIGLVGFTPIGYWESIPVAIRFLSDIFTSSLHHMKTGALPGGGHSHSVLWYPVTSIMFVGIAFGIYFSQVSVNRLGKIIVGAVFKGRQELTWSSYGSLLFFLILLLGVPWFFALVIWLRMWIWTQTGL